MKYIQKLLKKFCDELQTYFIVELEDSSSQGSQYFLIG